jgi:hypothetical protein
VTLETSNSQDTIDYSLFNPFLPTVYIDGGGQTNDTITFEGLGNGAIGGLGSGDILDLTSGNSDYVTLVAGDTVNLGNSTSLEDITGSSDTINEGSSADAKIIGSNDTITLGTSDNVLASGTGDHITGSSGDVIDLAANETVTITGSGETIVGMTGDIINVTGTSDHIYADSSNIQIIGNDTGDIVYGSGDTGDTSNWGGYVNQGGGYGGYYGGGYYAATARKPRSTGGTSKPAMAQSAEARRPSIGASIDTLVGRDNVASASTVADLYARPASRSLATTAASVSVPSQVPERPLALRSAFTSVNQLIHAMATWPAADPGAVATAGLAGHGLSPDSFLATPYAFAGRTRPAHSLERAA